MMKNKNKYHNPVIFGGHTSPSVILSGHTSPSVILSGCEGSMDSSANAFRMTTEGGRSMVEMLGVLAIIGVLSVGGIAGYKMAMNKYRANEILNGASMRAMIVSAQLQRNSNATPNLGEFSGAKVAGATFDTTVSYTAESDAFSLTVSGVAPNVCEQIHGTIPENGNVNIDSECTTFTYNADLSKGVLPPPSMGIECDSTNACQGGATCVRGRCECATGVWVPTSATAGTCKTLDSGSGNCSTNKDCNNGSEKGDKYCKYASVDPSTGPSEKGTCTPISSADYTTLTKENGKGIEGIISNTATGMNWWNAKNFCAAHGMHMPTFAESLVDKSKLGTSFNTNGICYDTVAKPDKGDKACEGGFAVSNYQSALSGKSWWTSEMNPNSSSYVFHVALSLGYVSNYFYNRSNAAYALCVR